MTRVGDSLPATSPADGSSSKSSSRSSTVPFLSVSPSEIPPSEDLKTRVTEVEGFEYRRIQEALGKCLGGKRRLGTIPLVCFERKQNFAVKFWDWRFDCVLADERS